MSEKSLADDATSGRQEALLERWSKLPRYLHFFTLCYFLTNIFNIWAYNRMAPHPAVGVLAVVGFVGGLAEHITPYFPRLTIPVTAEKILFRAPTIAATALLFFSMSPWLPWTLLLIGWAVYFWRAPGLSTLEIGFHLRHLGVTHLGGTCVTVVWLMIHAKSPLFIRIYSAPFG